MSCEKYLALSKIQKAGSLAPGTNVEVIIQSHGGSERKIYKSCIHTVNQTSQLGNEQVILMNSSGVKKFVGGGTSVRSY